MNQDVGFVGFVFLLSLFSSTSHIHLFSASYRQSIELQNLRSRSTLVVVYSLVMSDSFAACQAPLSMGFPRQEHWSGLPFPSLGGVPNPGIKPKSFAFVHRFFTTEPAEASQIIYLLGCARS